MPESPPAELSEALICIATPHRTRPFDGKSPVQARNLRQFGLCNPIKILDKRRFPVVRTAARGFIPIGNRALAAKPPVKSRLCSALGTGGPRGPKTPLGPGNGRLGSGRIRARLAAPPVGSTGHAYAGVSSGGPFKTGSSWSRILFGVGLPVRLAPLQDGVDDVDAVACQRGDGGVVVLALGPLLPVVLLRPRVGVRRHERRLEHCVL